MVIDTDGYLHVIHISMRGEARHFTSKKPNSIAEWDYKAIEPLERENIGISNLTPYVYEKTGEMIIMAHALFKEDDYFEPHRKFIMMHKGKNDAEWSSPQVIINLNNPNDNNSPYHSRAMFFAPANDQFPDRLLFSLDSM